MPIRATLDPSVIASWHAAAMAHRRKFRPAHVTLWVGLLIAVAIGILWPLAFLYVFPFGFAQICLFYVERARLLCPHCGKSPVESFSRQSPVDVEYCAHCYYWLKPPACLGGR